MASKEFEAELRDAMRMRRNQMGYEVDAEKLNAMIGSA